MDPAETIEFWQGKPHDILVPTAAALTRQLRQLRESAGFNEVNAYRACLAQQYIHGSGVEVGAGDRPWPRIPNAKCYYGDVRDIDGLFKYFRNDSISFDGVLNAQTFEGVPDREFDFVLSGHVIEHLPDPIGCIRETMRVLKSGGIFLLAVPDMRYTDDCNRPPTTLEHLLNDERDGGGGTRLQAYEEHVRFVHTRSNPPFSEQQVLIETRKISEIGMDIHYHAWTGDSFCEMLAEIKDRFGFRLLHHVSVQNENIYVLEKS